MNTDENPESSPTKGSLLRILVYWLPVILIMALIFAGSTRAFSGEKTGHWLIPIYQSIFPNAEMATLELLVFLTRKLAHVVEYAILSILCWRALTFAHRFPPPHWKKLTWNRRHAWLAFAIAALYGASDELHQAFVPGRYSSFSDIIADSLGASIGLILIYWAVRLIQKSSHRNLISPDM